MYSLLRVITRVSKVIILRIRNWSYRRVLKIVKFIKYSLLFNLSLRTNMGLGLLILERCFDKRFFMHGKFFTRNITCSTLRLPLNFNHGYFRMILVASSRVTSFAVSGAITFILCRTAKAHSQIKQLHGSTRSVGANIFSSSAVCFTWDERRLSEIEEEEAHLGLLFFRLDRLAL